MRIFYFFLLSSIAIAMPPRSKAGSGAFGRAHQPNINQIFNQVDEIPVVQVEPVDPYGNDGLFRALRLQRRTAIRNLIGQIRAGDHAVIRLIGLEFIEEIHNFERRPLRIPVNFHVIFQRLYQDSSQIDALRDDDSFRDLLVWYLRQEYVDGDESPRYISGYVGVFAALAYVYRIELFFYETNNDSVAQFRERLAFFEENQRRAVLLRHVHHGYERYNRLALAAEHVPGGRVRLEYAQREPLPLLHELHPAHDPHLTVVFDLDETLANNQHLGRHPALLRPHTLELLERLQQTPGVEIVLWTASLRHVAQPVVQQLERDGIIFDTVIYRDNRWFEHTEQIPYVKDLTLLGRDLGRVVMVENTPGCIRLQPNNALLVEDFINQTEDHTLLHLLEVLTELVGQNVPEFLRNLRGRPRELLHDHGAFVKVLSRP